MTYVSMFLDCPICKAHYWKTDHHVCPPRFRVRLDPDIYGDDDVEGKLIYADTAMGAAEKFASWWCSSTVEYSTVDVYVRPEGGDTWEPYLVDVDFVPQFGARPDKKRKSMSVEVEAEEDESEDDNEH